MNNKYGCVNISELKWAGRYLALFSLSTVSEYGGGWGKNEQTKKFFRWQFQAYFLSQLHWCIFTAKLLLLVHEIYRRILCLLEPKPNISLYMLCMVLDLGEKNYYTDLKYPAATSTLHLVPNLSGHWLISTGLRCISQAGMNCMHPADVPSLPVVLHKFIHLFSAQNPCITISMLQVASTNLWFFDSLSQCMWELGREVCARVCVCVFQAAEWKSIWSCLWQCLWQWQPALLVEKPVWLEPLPAVVVAGGGGGGLGVLLWSAQHMDDESGSLEQA